MDDEGSKKEKKHESLMGTSDGLLLMAPKGIPQGTILVKHCI